MTTIKIDGKGMKALLSSMSEEKKLEFASSVIQEFAKNHIKVLASDTAIAKAVGQARVANEKYVKDHLEGICKKWDEEPSLRDGHQILLRNQIRDSVHHIVKEDALYIVKAFKAEMATTTTKVQKTIESLEMETISQVFQELVQEQVKAFIKHDASFKQVVAHEVKNTLRSFT
jgi:hypothetical protein